MAEAPTSRVWKSDLLGPRAELIPWCVGWGPLWATIPRGNIQGMASFQCSWLEKAGKLPTVPDTEGVLGKSLPSGQKFHQPHEVLQVPAWNPCGGCDRHWLTQVEAGPLQ